MNFTERMRKDSDVSSLINNTYTDYIRYELLVAISPQKF